MGVGDRLYYRDSYITEFTARVTGRDAGGLRVYLDRTAFYPSSGGQPHDTGTIAGAPVLEVIDEGDRIAHALASPVAGGDVECRIDWPRRFDHMQQHTGQHLLSAVLEELYGIPTVGFHLGAVSSLIDVGASGLDAGQIENIEHRAAEIVFENRPVTVSFEENPAGLRKASERDGELRIISIDGLDRSACGGTHVRATGEIGPVAIRKLDKAHGALRIEFLCGWRALRRARTDYQALSRVARVFNATLDDAPALVAAEHDALSSAEKVRRRQAVELARYKGHELYEATPAAPDGVRRAVHRLAKGALDEELRALAQSFTAHPKAAFLAIVEDPPSLLLAASKDSGIDAGKFVKAAVAAAGGRGGGSPQMAQGGVPTASALDAIVADFRDGAGAA